MRRDIEQVKEFHEVFNHAVSPMPVLLTSKDIKTRLNLIKEEVQELEDALNDLDIVEVLDALCDINYVVNGTILACGLQDVFTKAFDEVHRSNMSKAHDTYEEAHITMSYYRSKGVECNEKLIQNKWIVYRTEDNKILKNINYSLANLRQFIKNFPATK
jgi:predicted HAD superfamily Cof-like phosphohydrolase